MRMVDLMQAPHGWRCTTHRCFTAQRKSFQRQVGDLIKAWAGLNPQFCQATPEHDSANNASGRSFGREIDEIFNQKGQCSDRRSYGKQTMNKNQQTSKCNVNDREDPVGFSQDFWELDISSHGSSCYTMNFNYLEET